MNDILTPADKRLPRNRPMQFTLATLFGCVFLFGVVFGLLRWFPDHWGDVIFVTITLSFLFPLIYEKVTRGAAGHKLAESGFEQMKRRAWLCLTHVWIAASIAGFAACAAIFYPAAPLLVVYVGICSSILVPAMIACFCWSWQAKRQNKRARG